MNSTHLHQTMQIKKCKKTLLNGEGDISLNQILHQESCQRIFYECREFRDRVYNPLKTVFTFIKKVLNPDKSCKKAVAEVVTESLSINNIEISSNTGPYCKARQRLPAQAVHELVQVTGKSSIAKTPSRWKPYGRELKVCDGSHAKMADTSENQAIFPQHKNQNKGAGFPLMRFLVVMSLTVGTIVDYAAGAYKGKGTGESSLLRRIFNSIEPNDIVLGDRYFPNFFLMADLKRIGADGIFKAQGQRCYDFRGGKRLGKKDHIVLWKKPNRPDWMSQEEYNGYPEEIEIREFKVNGAVYVTTFLDDKKYHRKELADIYKRRWEVELNLKSIKSIMNMDMLSCKTPDMVMKELGIHLLAYNFIRIMMAEACIKNGGVPWKISFKGAIQLINAFMPYFLNSTIEKNNMMYARMLVLIVKNVTGNRPNRVEPRLLKQRQKPFPVLKRPRAIEKEKLMRKVERMILKNAVA